MTPIKNLSLLTISLLILGVLIYLLDTFIGIFWPLAGLPKTPQTLEISKSNYNQHLGYVPLLKVPNIHRKVFQGKLLYQVQYRFDAPYFRRKVPLQSGTKNRFALFFGGSNTFGEGLTEEQTLPLEFERRKENYRSYNYAYRGHGPQHMLGRLRQGFKPGEIVEKEGTAFYLFYEYHINRAIGSMNVIRWSQGKSPYYFISQDGSLRSEGTFADSRSLITWLYLYLSRSNIGRHLETEWPQIDDSHIKLTCEIFLESKKRLASMNSQLILILGNSKTAISRKFTDQCLIAKNFKYIELYPETGYTDDTHIIENDGHLNASGVEYVAQKIADFVTAEKMK